MSILIIALAVVFFFVFFINFIMFSVGLFMYDYDDGFSISNVFGLIFNPNSKAAQDQKIIKYKKRMIIYGVIGVLCTIIAAYSLGK